MIERIGMKLSSFLVKYQAIPDKKETIDYYRYGIEITLSSMLNVIIILLIGVIAGYPLESIVFLLVFIPLRQYTGGFHASTYLRCNVYFALCFSLSLLLYAYTKDSFTINCSIIISVFSLIVISSECPIENKNKKLTRQGMKRHKITAIILCVLFGMCSVILKVLSYSVGVIISYTLALITILVIVATLQKLREGGYHE